MGQGLHLAWHQFEHTGRVDESAHVYQKSHELQREKDSEGLHGHRFGLWQQS